MPPVKHTADREGLLWQKLLWKFTVQGVFFIVDSKIASKLMKKCDSGTNCDGEIHVNFGETTSLTTIVCYSSRVPQNNTQNLIILRRIHDIMNFGTKIRTQKQANVILFKYLTWLKNIITGNLTCFFYKWVNILSVPDKTKPKKISNSCDSIKSYSIFSISTYINRVERFLLSPSDHCIISRHNRKDQNLKRQ